MILKLSITLLHDKEELVHTTTGYLSDTYGRLIVAKSPVIRKKLQFNREAQLRFLLL